METRGAGQMNMDAREWKSCHSRCRPLSVVMVGWHPKRIIHPERVLATASDVMSGRGMASGQQEKWSTAVRQYLKTSDVGSAPMMSICACRNQDIGRATSPSGVVVYLDISRLARLHARAQVQLSFCTTGHMKCWAMNFAVSLNSGWTRRCRVLNTCRRRVTGTYGRGLVANVS
jgi:hypothetical protein